MKQTYLSRVNWKSYRIGYRIEKDADDRNYVWVVGTVNGKDVLASNHFNEHKNVAEAISNMMNRSLPNYLNGQHHETHYPERFFA